jgi:hypothetical protein
MSRKKIAVLFVILTLVNLLVFLFRDYFQYQPYAGMTSLYRRCDQSCMEKWRAFTEDYPSRDLTEAKQLMDSVLGNRDAGSFAKTQKIARFLVLRFQKQLGTPSVALLKAAPLDQYKMLSASDTLQLWCGNFAQLFSFFCWSEGIACRSIEIMNPGDHHVLNECYLPETGRWMMVDLTNNLLFVRDKEQQLLNLVNFRQQVQHGLPVQSERAAGGTVIAGTGGMPIPGYYLADHPLYYYHRVNNQKTYAAKEKITRYLLPVSWYDIYDDQDQNNYLFYLKELLILLWIAAGFILLLKSTKLNT